MLETSFSVVENIVDTKFDIIIAGAGPAGALTAILLARLGYRVAIHSNPRGRGRIEGFSQRTVDILSTHGLKNARAAVGPLVERIASWAGEQGARNQEYVTERSRFDDALLKDVVEHGIRILETSKIKVAVEPGHVDIACSGNHDDENFRAQFFVEARGRAAPVGRRKNLTGPPTTALVRRVEGAPPSARTAVAGFSDGWAWFVADGAGPAYLQIFVDSRDGLPKREHLAEFFSKCAGKIAEREDWLKGRSFSGPVMSHNTAPFLSSNALSERYLRVGDAACALDPLSGNGVFAALGGALSASPVIHTLLRKPETSELAKSFYIERAKLTFERFCRTGRDFYRLETRWADRPFWRARAAWPDDQSSHPAPNSAPVRFERKPVVENGFIVEREVCVTPDYPRGIWQVDQVSISRLVEILKPLQSQSLHKKMSEIAEQLGNTEIQVSTAIDWLRFRQVLKAGDAITF